MRLKITEQAKRPRGRIKASPDKLLAYLQKESSFTLIELLVVLAIIGIIAAIALAGLAAQVDRAKGSRALAELRSMKAVVEMHYVEKSELPAADNSDADGTVRRVMNESGIPWGDLSDPWGGVYWYRADQPRYIIFTAKDGSTYYYVTDRHPPTAGPFPGGYPVSGGVPSKASGSGRPTEPPEEPPPSQEPSERQLPSVVTMDATNITKNKATLNMAYDFKGYGLGQVQFAYKRSGDPDYSYTSWVDKAGSGTYAETIRGLKRNTTYYFKARLKYGDMVVEGSELSFTTR